MSVDISCPPCRADHGEAYAPKMLEKKATPSLPATLHCRDRKPTRRRWEVEKPSRRHPRERSSWLEAPKARSKWECVIARCSPKDWRDGRQREVLIERCRQRPAAASTEQRAEDPASLRRAEGRRPKTAPPAVILSTPPIPEGHDLQPKHGRDALRGRHGTRNARDEKPASSWARKSAE